MTVNAEDIPGTLFSKKSLLTRFERCTTCLCWLRATRDGPGGLKNGKPFVAHSRIEHGCYTLSLWIGTRRAPTWSYILDDDLRRSWRRLL